MKGLANSTRLQRTEPIVSLLARKQCFCGVAIGEIELYKVELGLALEQREAGPPSAPDLSSRSRYRCRRRRCPTRAAVVRRESR